MSMSRSLGSLVVRIAAEGLGGYKADLDRAASDTTAAAQRIERAADQASGATGRLGRSAGSASGDLGKAAQVADVLYGSLGMVGVAAGTVAGLIGVAAYAAHQGSKEQNEYSKALIMSGNAAGTTAQQMALMARDVGKVVGIQYEAAAALATMAGTGQVAGRNLQAFAQTALQMERAVGQSVAETVKQFDSLGKEPVKASARLNESLNYLTAATYEQIKAAEELGDKEKAASIAQNAYASEMGGRATQIIQNLGLIERSMLSVETMAKRMWSAVMDVGRQADPLDEARKRAAEIEHRLANPGLMKNFRENPDELRAELVGLQGYYGEVDRLNRRVAEGQAQYRQDQKAGIEAAEWLGKTNEQAASKTEKLSKALEEYHRKIEDLRAANPNSALLDPKTIADAEAGIRKRFQEVVSKPPAVKADAWLTDVARSYSRTMDELGRVQDAASAKADNLSKSQEKLRDVMGAPEWQAYSRQQREQLIYSASLAQTEEDRADATKAAADAVKAATKEHDKYIADLKKSADAVENHVQKLKDEEEALVLAAALNVSLSQAIELVEIARLQEAQAVQMSYGDDVAVAALEREIQKRVELIGLMGRKESRDEVESFWKSVESAGHDAFLNLEDGWDSMWKRAGKSLKAGVLDMLWQFFAKKWILNIGASMSGGGSYGDMLAGATGNGTGASMLGGMLSSGGSMLGNAASTVGGWLGWGGATAAGTGIAASVGTGTALAATGSGLGLSAGAAGTGYGFAAGGGLGMTAGSAGASTIGAGLGTSAAAGGSGAAAAGGSSVLAAIPVWGWVALAAIAIASQAKGETRSGGQYSYDANTGVAALLQGPSGGEIQGDLVRQSIAGTAGGINGLLKGMGSTAVLTSFQAGLEQSDRGRGGVFGGGTFNNGVTFGDSGKGSNYEGTLYEKTSSTSPDSKEAFANFTAEMFQDTIQAVQAAVKSGAGVPDTIAKMVDGVDSEAMTSEAAQALVANMQATVTGVTALHDAMQTIGLKELSFDAAAGLIAAAGGMDKLGNSLATYYDRFYSADEKTGVMTKNIAAEFAKLGITMPAVNEGTRAWYRSEVERLMALDQAVPANAKATADILSLAGAVDQIAPAMDSATGSVQGFTDTVMGLVDGIHNSVAGSIFDMQYGLKDDAGKYGMLDQQAKGYDDAMRGATDINQIAEFAQKEIDTINKAFALLDPQQQADKLGEMTALLTKVDEFVTQSGADAISLKKAENADLADAVATAVEKALETLSARMADTAIALAASTAKMGDAVSRPAEVTVFVSAPTGSEVRVSQ